MAVDARGQAERTPKQPQHRLDQAFPYRAKVRSCALKHKGVSDVQLRQDGKVFAIAGWDHKVRLYDWKTRQALAVLRHHQDGIQTLSFSPNTTGLAAGSNDARVTLWDLSIHDR